MNYQTKVTRYRILMLFALPALFFSFAVQQKKVLIIGDSISLGYFPSVRKQLTNEVEVSHNPGNAQHTGTGLKLIDKWLGDERYDVILFNWGLWDLCYRHPESKAQGKKDKRNGKITYPLESYKANVEQLVQRLKETGAKLVFVTTTVIPSGEAGRFEGDEVKYNDAAKEIMKKYNVQVCDLHRYSIAIHKNHKKGEGDVHYTEKGYQELGKYIVKAIKKALK